MEYREEVPIHEGRHLFFVAIQVIYNSVGLVWPEFNCVFGKCLGGVERVGSDIW